MEKRALLAVVLSIGVFYLFSMVLGPKTKQLPESASTKPVPPVAAPAPAPQSVSVPITSSANAPAPPQALKVQGDVVVETVLYSATFSPRSGSLKAITLKNYREENSPKAKPVILGNDADPSLLNFSTRATGFNLPVSAIFVSDSGRLILSGSESKKLTFTYISGEGFTVHKIYTFNSNSYGINLETQVINNSPVPLVGIIQQVMTYPPEPKVKDNRFDTAGSFLYADNSLRDDKIKDVASASKKYDKGVLWAGFADKYFLSAICQRVVV